MIPLAFNIDDTIILKDGNIENWLYTDKNEILSFKPKKKCTFRNFMDNMLNDSRIFTKNHVVCLKYKSEDGLNYKWLNLADFVQELRNIELTRNQKFMSSDYDDRITLIRVSYTNDEAFGDLFNSERLSIADNEIIDVSPENSHLIIIRSYLKTLKQVIEKIGEVKINKLTFDFYLKDSIYYLFDLVDFQTDYSFYDNMDFFRSENKISNYIKYCEYTNCNVIQKDELRKFDILIYTYTIMEDDYINKIYQRVTKMPNNNLQNIREYFWRYIYNNKSSEFSKADKLNLKKNFKFYENSSSLNKKEIYLCPKCYFYFQNVNRMRNEFFLEYNKSELINLDDVNHFIYNSIKNQKFSNFLKTSSSTKSYGLSKFEGKITKNPSNSSKILNKKESKSNTSCTTMK